VFFAEDICLVDYGSLVVGRGGVPGKIIYIYRFYLLA